MAGFIGKVAFVSVDGEKVQCETNATFNLETGLTAISRCKGEGRFQKSVIGANSWDVEVEANALLNNIATNQFHIIEKMLDTGMAQIVFQSDPIYWENDEKFAIAGPTVITNLTWDNPSADGSTWTATFVGAGPFEFTREPNIIAAWSQDGLNIVSSGRKRKGVFVTEL